VVDQDGEAYGGPAEPSPTIAQCLNGGLGWLEVECNRCKTRASLPLDAIRRPRSTPIWKLEASLKCRSCRKGRYAPPVHMIRLTETQEISPYPWGILMRSAKASGAPPSRPGPASLDGNAGGIYRSAPLSLSDKPKAAVYGQREAAGAHENRGPYLRCPTLGLLCATRPVTLPAS
jgi:hypothetical protein